MRLSTSLSRNVMEATVGGLIYKFKIRGRRHVLFFEEIMANYIKECEKVGHVDEMRDIGREWGSLIIKQRVPDVLKKLPPHIFLNIVMGRIWVNLGLMDSLIATKKGELIEVQTKNEAVTRFNGKTAVSIGYYEGILSILNKSQVECIDSIQTKESCKYKFKIINVPFDVESKDKNAYLRLNYLPEIEGFTLKDALRKNIFQLNEKNQICFRKKLTPPVENTVFHLFSNRGILIEAVSDISYDYFKEIIQEDSSDEEKLVLLKTLLQVMGWGKVKFSKGLETAKMIISNPPYGLQKEKDNWDFLIMTVLGYLWTLDRGFRVSNIEESYKKIGISFSKINQ